MLSGSKSALGLTRSTMLAIRALLRQNNDAPPLGSRRGIFISLVATIQFTGQRWVPRDYPGGAGAAAAFSGNRDIRVRLHRFGSARAALVHTPEAPTPSAKQALDAAGT